MPKKKEVVLNAGDDVGLGGSGGPTMTIERIEVEGASSEQIAHVVWFEVDEKTERWTLQREKFPLVALRPAEDE